MSKTNIQEWLITNNGFKKEFNTLLKASISHQFKNLREFISEENKIDWKYMLLCASILSKSLNESCQSISLRIAHYCLESNFTTEIEKNAAVIILDSLRNKPAIKLAEKRKLIKENIELTLSITLLQDWTRRSIENSIYLFNESFLEVNKFQRNFWEQAEQNDWLSISAPTSVGKSYIIERWIAYFVKNNKFSTIVYIVPTRALISQVQHDINDILIKYKITDYTITTLPIHSSISNNKSNILILTQERFHIFLNDNELGIHLLIIDEAHKVGDNYRGVLLQHAIDTAIIKNPQCKVIFASPMTNNPELLLEDSPFDKNKSSIFSEEVTVNQNLFWISQEYGNPKKWIVELVHNDSIEKLGIINLKFSPTPESKKLPFIAFELSNPYGGNVIYVNGAADAEKTAKQIYDLIPDILTSSEKKQIEDLIDLIKKIIHPKYALVNSLKKGIAFHYGNIPLLIRNEIEKLFGTGVIKYLICTSTLIEGINMPCQNLFVRGPCKGRGKPMNETDFWNLAGRAGRWGKEFQGNIFCIDAKLPRIWKNGPPKNRQKYAIKRTTDDVIIDQDFFDYIDKKSPIQISNKNPKFEYVFSFLSAAYINKGCIKNTLWANRFDLTIVKLLDSKIEIMFKEINIPNEIILKNPGISPYAMNDLFNYFIDRTDNENKLIDELLPVDPESDNALNVYTQILHRINKYLSNVFGVRGRVCQLALLIIDWMKGFPLSRIISSRESYYKKKNNLYKLDNLIRDTMSDVEEFARFQAPKYLACYSDILRYFFLSRDRQDLANKLLEMHILLEFGVSQKTQLSLIGIGLSRSSAILISEIITNDSLSEKEVIEWLKSNEWMTSNMPELVKMEIKEIIDKS